MPADSPQSLDPRLLEVAFRCGAAARWLPRTLAAAMLVSAMLVAYRFDPHRSMTFAREIQALVVVVGAALGLWIARTGSELRLTVRAERERLELSYGRQASTVRFDDIERLAFEAPLGAARRLWPATLLIDRAGREWRLPALLRDGDRLIEALVANSGRDDLAAWVDSLKLRQRMAHSGALTATGYGLAVLAVAAALLFYLR